MTSFWRFLSSLTTLLTLCLVILAWGWVGLYYAPGPLQSETRVIIPKGSTLGTIAQKLDEALALRFRSFFVLAARLQRADNSLKAGEYALPPQASVRDIMVILKEGKSIPHALTIPEGLMTVQILDLIKHTGILEGTLTEQPAEGSLLPETYYYTYGDTPDNIVRRMKVAQENALQKAWAGRRSDLPLASPQEAVILASIVEKETGVAAERSRVAGVFINRLKKGMPLQSDPTVMYAVTEGKNMLERPLSRRDLSIQSPYNTYVVQGLPPGPIAHPGRLSLEAVLNPEVHDYLYFVADGSGGHVFASTLAQHNRNVARWRKIEKELKKAPR